MTFVDSARIWPSSNPSVELQNLSQIPDFYSTSECRDLLFHVQEHRLTLGQIESFLAESGLHFIGFEVDRQRATSVSRTLYRRPVRHQFAQLGTL